MRSPTAQRQGSGTVWLWTTGDMGCVFPSSFVVFMSGAQRPAVSGGPQPTDPRTGKKPALWAVRSTGMLGAGPPLARGSPHARAAERVSHGAGKWQRPRGWSAAAGQTIVGWAVSVLGCFPHGFSGCSWVFMSCLAVHGLSGCPWCFPSWSGLVCLRGFPLFAPVAPNAGGEPRPMAGATQERKLLGVAFRVEPVVTHPAPPQSRT
jgi:hypothetical protein